MRLLAVLVLLGAMALPALAGARLELFVKNRAFQGDSRIFGTDLYVALDDFLRANDWSWTEEGERLMIWSRPGGGPALKPERRQLVMDGRALQVGQEPFAGRLYLWVEDFARAVGARYQVNESLGTADFFPAAAVGGGTGVRKATDGKGSNGSPLRLEKLSFKMEAPEGVDHPVMRGYAVVKNTAMTPVEDLLLRVQIQDASGADRGGFDEVVGTVKPGEEVTWQFPVWTNFEEASAPRPVLFIEHR